MKPISSFKSHAAREQLLEYRPEAPAGRWIGRLDAVAWGKSQNLLCFFTEETTGRKYRLSTFWNRQFGPQNEGPDFRNESAGNLYEIGTVPGKTGLSRFEAAKRLDRPI